MKDLNSTVNQLDLIDIYRPFHLINRINIISGTHGILCQDRPYSR